MVDNNNIINIYTPMQFHQHIKKIISELQCPSPVNGEKGDGNLDSLVNGMDIQGMVDAITAFNASANHCAYDMNEDGLVNLDDIAPFIETLTTGN